MTIQRKMNTSEVIVNGLQTKQKIMLTVRNDNFEIISSQLVSLV